MVKNLASIFFFLHYIKHVIFFGGGRGSKRNDFCMSLKLWNWMGLHWMLKKFAEIGTSYLRMPAVLTNHYNIVKIQKDS